MMFFYVDFNEILAVNHHDIKLINNDMVKTQQPSSF